MNKNLLLGVILVSLLLSACGIFSAVPGETTKASGSLPEDELTLLYQPGLISDNMSFPDMSLYALPVEGGEAVRWQPRGQGDLDLWALSPEAYRFVGLRSESGKANRALFMGPNGRYANYNIKDMLMGNVSPDGRYVRDVSEGTLLVKRIDETEFQPIATNVKWGSNWSLDGKRLLYITEDAEVNRLFLYDVAQQTQQLVLESEGEIDYRAWSPDGSAFAFVAVGEDGPVLYQYTADGKTRLTADSLPLTDVERVLFMPDGRAVLVIGISDDVSHIWRVATDGTGVTPFFETDKRIHQLKLSENGEWLVFYTDDGWQQDRLVALTRIPVAGGPPLVTWTPIYGKAVLSPDGEKIGLFMGKDIGRLLLLDTAEADSDWIYLAPQGVPSERGTEETVKGDDTSLFGISNFVWSLDSQQVYLTAALEDACGTESEFSMELIPHTKDVVYCQYSLYRVNADGSDWQQVGDFQTPPMQSEASNLFWLP